MSITVTIVGDNGQEVLAQLRSLLGTSAAPVEEAPATEGKPKATRKKAEPAAAAAETTDTAAEASPPATTDAKPPAATTDEPVDAAAIKARAMKFTQAKGPQALVDKIKEIGAASGAFKDLDEAGLAALSDFLASEEF